MLWECWPSSCQCKLCLIVLCQKRKCIYTQNLQIIIFLETPCTYPLWELKFSPNAFNQRIVLPQMVSPSFPSFGTAGTYVFHDQYDMIKWLFNASFIVKHRNRLKKSFKLHKLRIHLFQNCIFYPFNCSSILFIWCQITTTVAIRRFIL